MQKASLLFIGVLILTLGCQPAPAPTPVPPTVAPTGAATPRPTGNLDMNPKFQDPKEPWCRGFSISTGQGYCQDGEFHLVHKGEAAGDSTIAAFTGSSLKNFMVQAQMRSVGGWGSYGIAFRSQHSTRSHYVFRVRASGHYQLVIWSGDHVLTPELIPWTPSSAIKKGQAENLIEVIVQGTQITLLANGDHLASITDPSSVQGAVGPVAAEQGHTAIKSFKVWWLPP